MDVIVQPSVPWMSLNDQIKGSGLFFPVDPGPSVSAPTLQIIPQSQIPEETGRFWNQGHLFVPRCAFKSYPWISQLNESGIYNS